MGAEIVMVGVSAGGLEAVCTILRGIPENFGMAIIVVQHRSKHSEALCEVLQDCSVLEVHEVMDKASIHRGHVYLAPPDYHLLVEEGYFALSVDAPEMFSRPSIDIAFESAANSYGARAVGVVLTGANHDGSRGLRHVVDRGGLALVQDPETAEVAVMPKAAILAVPEARVLSLVEIAAYLVTLAPSTTSGDGRGP